MSSFCFLNNDSASAPNVIPKLRVPCIYIYIYIYKLYTYIYIYIQISWDIYIYIGDDIGHFRINIL